MKKMLDLKLHLSYHKLNRGLISVLLVWIMVFNLVGCGDKNSSISSEDIEPINVVRKKEPMTLQTANKATSLALRQYIYARLLTEEFLLLDASSMTMEELSIKGDELLLAWENANIYSFAAEDITNQAVQLLESKESSSNKSKSIFTNHVTRPFDFQHLSYAAESGRKIDPQTWAENLTKQFDALKGAKRYQQLGKQLGTDARTAYEQMSLAQKIIKNAAELEEAEGVVNSWTDSINYLKGIKTTSKVAMMGWSIAATGGGSVALLEGAGLIVGGVDCIVDVTETSSTIILGENSQVAVTFGELKDKLGPVSSLIGLVTLSPGDIGSKAKETTDAVVYIADSLIDLFYEDKIMGIKVEGVSNQAVNITTEVFKAGAQSALEAAGFILPGNKEVKSLSEILKGWKPDSEIMIARLDALASQMAAIKENPELFQELIEIVEQTSPEESENENKEEVKAEVDNGKNQNLLTGWPDNFYGQSLIAPDTKGNITESLEEVSQYDGSRSHTIRIDNMSYEEFYAYCSKLESIDGWIPYEKDILANMPKDEPNEGYYAIYFGGSYGSLPHISMRYIGEFAAEDKGIPQFMIFVFETWD